MMSESIGPVLATGLIVTANKALFNDEGVDWRVIAATGFAAGFFTIIEKPFPDAAKMLAWTGLVTVLFTRVNNKPSPTENFLKWWNK
jgi:predicted phosphatase